MVQVNPTTQFINALEALKERGIPLNEVCREMGTDASNVRRLRRTPESFSPRPQWMAALCRAYAVSPAFLLLAEGPVFRQ